jgi:hypothetical protein
MRAFSLRLVTCLSFVACLGLVGCGSDSSGSGDAGPPDGPPPPDSGPDAPPPDAAPPDGPPPTGIGALCPVGNECNPGLLCLDENADAELPPNGYCTAMCTSDLDCGWDSFCSPPLGGGIRLCFQRCETDETECQGAPERVCGDLLGGVVATSERGCFPGNPGAHDGDSCSGFYECNRNSTCFLDSFQLPGGYCVTLGCTIGDNSTCAPGGDGICIMADGDLLCVDDCTTTPDCRASEGYMCVTPPGFPTSICLFTHLDPGAACSSATECGAAGSGWDCLTGTTFPGGYCSGAIGTCDATDPATCPNGATCFDPTPGMPANGDQFCAANCDSSVTPSSCREGEGYVCSPADNVCTHP